MARRASPCSRTLLCAGRCFPHDVPAARYNRKGPMVGSTPAPGHVGTGAIRIGAMPMTGGGSSTEAAGDDAGRRFHVVVLGTGPVGKTSLINALLGRSAGQTGATMGTTAHGRSYTHEVEGVEGTLLLTDTPGL